MKFLKSREIQEQNPLKSHEKTLGPSHPLSQQRNARRSRPSSPCAPRSISARRRWRGAASWGVWPSWGEPPKRNHGFLSGISHIPGESVRGWLVWTGDGSTVSIVNGSSRSKRSKVHWDIMGPSDKMGVDSWYIYSQWDCNPFWWTIWWLRWIGKGGFLKRGVPQ